MIEISLIYFYNYRKSTAEMSRQNNTGTGSAEAKIKPGASTTHFSSFIRRITGAKPGIQQVCISLKNHNWNEIF